MQRNWQTECYNKIIQEQLKKPIQRQFYYVDLIYDFSNVIDKDPAVSLLPNKTKILGRYVPSLQIV